MAERLESGGTKGTRDREPERTCAVTRAKLPPDDLIRFVEGPDGSIVPDVACRLPGRGVWVELSRARVAEAAKRGAFARSLKHSIKVPEALEETVERLLARRVAEALSLAKKAGLVVSGFTKTDVAISRGEAEALLHASDAAEDGRGKLDRKYMAVLKDLEAGGEPQIVDILSCAELSLAIGRPHVVHAALIKGGAATHFLREAGRLKRYRANTHAKAAMPPQPGSDTEQA